MKRIAISGLTAGLLWGGIGAAFLSLTLSATEPETCVFDSYTDFASGNCRSVTLSEEGILAPAPLLHKITGIKADQIWSILPEVSGSLLVGTSPEARLYRVQNEGNVAEVYKFEGTHICALTRNNKGEVFVAVSPEGKIYKLNSDSGKSLPPTLYFDTKQKYVWSMAFDKEGNLFAGTGLEGKIFKITAQTKGAVFCETGEVHVRTMKFDRVGNLWAGSSDTGLLFRISPEGKAVVIANTGRQEINQIAVSPEGTIYFSATGVSKQSVPKPKNLLGGLIAGLPTLSITNADSEDSGKSPLLFSSRSAAPTQPIKPAESASLSQLWRLGSALFPEVIWSTRETIMTLDATAKELFVGTSGEGYYYRINAKGLATRVVKLEAPAITATLFPDKGGDGQILASSNPAALYELKSHREAAGIYESKVIDSGVFATWGAIRTMGQGRFTVQTRSGNTLKPDRFWNPWVTVKQEKSQSPPARYLQFSLQIEEGTVDRVELVYLDRNLPPKIEQIEILPPGVGYAPIITPPNPPQAKVAEQLLGQSAHSEGDATGAMPVFRLQTRYQPAESRGMRTAVWKASDPNGDDLRYTVFTRLESSKTWRVLAKDLKDNVLSWDASGWPDGNYFLKVTASDQESNAPENALTDELESRLFTVDNTPPVIKILSSRNGLALFTVSDESSELKSVTVSTDGRDYVVARPTDGILDSKSETFEVKLGKDEMLFIRAEDESGNIGSSQILP